MKSSWGVIGAGVVAASVLVAAKLGHQPSPATQAGASADRPATHVITLGTGAGYATVGRAQTSSLLVIKGKVYLIDAGAGVTRRLAESGARFSAIGQIFLTDHHEDHVGGLANLLNTQSEWARRSPVEIYGPPGTEALVADKARFTPAEGEIRWVEGRPVPLGEMFVGKDAAGGLVFRDENVTVTALENIHPHFAEAKPGEIMEKSYSYRFETADRIVVFTGDCDPNAALAEFAHGADLLVAEVTSLPGIKDTMLRNGMARHSTIPEQQSFIRHMLAEHLTPDEAGRLATHAGVGQVVFTRLSPASGMDDYAQYLARTARGFFGRVVIAYDHMQL